jgi:prephenate dehydratase
LYADGSLNLSIDCLLDIFIGKSSNTVTPAVVPETETVATAKKSEADTAVVHDQVLGITHVIAANPGKGAGQLNIIVSHSSLLDGCYEQLIDALQQVWVEPVCFINVSAENHERVLEHMDALTFSNYHTKCVIYKFR